MEVRGLKSNEKEKLFDMQAEAFAPKTPREYFVRCLENEPYYREELTRVVVDSGSVLASVQIFDRTMRLGQETVLRMGGIGNVASPSRYAGKGYGTMLMRDSIKYMKENHIPVSLLFCSILDYYQVFKWSVIPTSYFVCWMTGGHKPEGFCEMDAHKSIDEMKTVYRDGIKGFLGTEEREEQVYWEKRLAAVNSQTPLRVAGIREGGRLTAYIIMAEEKKERDAVRVYEVLALPGREPLMEQLLGAVLPEKEQKIYFPFGIDHLLSQALVARGVKYETQDKTWAMIKIIDVPLFLEQMIPEWERRIRESGEKFEPVNLRIFDVKEPSAIEIAPGGIKIIKPEKSMTAMTTKTAELPLLVFFPCKFYAKTTLPEDVVEILKIMIPERPYVFFSLDIF